MAHRGARDVNSGVSGPAQHGSRACAAHTIAARRTEDTPEGANTGMRQTAPTLTHRLAVIDPTTDARWDAFVRAHPASTVFHTAAWARVLIATYGYEPRYHVLE